MNVTVDISRLTSLIVRTRRQLNKTVNASLNEIGEKVRKKEVQSMRTMIDRPTPFTLKGMIVRKAYSNNHRVIVQMKDIQAKYLELIIKGGTSSKVKPLLTRRAMNKYGNVPKNYTRRTKSNDRFLFLKGRIVGKWSRSRTYRKQFDFFGIGEKEAKRIYKRTFRKHLIFSR